jgi:hypothetical protein
MAAVMHCVVLLRDKPTRTLNREESARISRVSPGVPEARNPIGPTRDASNLIKARSTRCSLSYTKMVQLRVALAQTCPINAEINSSNDSNPFSNVEGNLLDATNQVKAASQAGAEVVVFPEYFLQGLVDQGRQVSIARN